MTDLAMLAWVWGKPVRPERARRLRPVLKKLVAARYSQRAIADEFNARQIETTSGRGRWHADGVMDLMRLLDVAPAHRQCILRGPQTKKDPIAELIAVYALHGVHFIADGDFVRIRE
jgi:hypothetical protein